MSRKIAIIGAGFAGIGAAYGIGVHGGGASVLFEKEKTFGGLCNGYTINGYHFDKAVHLSFTTNKLCREVFFSIPYDTHEPESLNYKNGVWIRHPVQNNLRYLPVKERIKIIESFCSTKITKVNNYRDWLRARFGEYFSKEYAEVYTRKYWGTEAENLSISWCGKRIYETNLSEMLYGSYNDAKKTNNVYYAKKMYYPKEGGYKAFLNNIARKLDIRYGYNLQSVDIINKKLRFANGYEFSYDVLINTSPLSEFIPLVCNDKDIVFSASQLKATSMMLVSVGFKRIVNIPALWFYVYDEDIPFARVHSPSRKTYKNAPLGRDSLQFEIYYSREKKLNEDIVFIKQKILLAIERMGIASKSDIEFIDFRQIKYANVIFYHDMEKHRNRCLKYLADNGIKSCGRFGLWDYLWSDQAFLSGVKVGYEQRIL